MPVPLTRMKRNLYFTLWLFFVSPGQHLASVLIWRGNNYGSSMKTLKKLKPPLHPDKEHGTDITARPGFPAPENNHFEGCACTGKTLTRLVRPAILAVLARENLHGYLILERLAERAMFNEQPADPAGIYRVLKSMEQEGLVHCAWDLQGSGPARRQYALAARGRSCLEQWLGTLEDYFASVGELVDDIRRVLDTSPGTAPETSPGTSPGAEPGNCASTVPPVGQPGSASGKPCCCASPTQSAPIDSSGSFGDS